MKTTVTAAALALLCNVGMQSPAFGQTREDEIVTSATNALNELMAIPGRSLTQSMVQRAEGIVIIPGMLKVGLVAGVRRGKGLAVVRDEKGAWQPPAFVTMTGGSFGFQVGVQATDVILVFNTRKSVSGLLSGKFTIGVDAAAAAGPVGRQAAAATDGQLGAEIYSYSRGRGLFAGASVDGSVLQIDGLANQAYYQGTGMLANGTPYTTNAQLPPSATRLLATLAAYSSNTDAGGANAGAPQLVPSNSGGNIQGGEPAFPSSSFPAGTAGTSGQLNQPDPRNLAGGTDFKDSLPQAKTDDLDEIRQQLALAASQLGALLDDAWREYLSLPKGVFSGSGTPSIASLEQSLKRFERVAKDSRYQLLLDRTEFQRAIYLLRTYTQQVRTRAQPTTQPPAEASRFGAPVRQSIR